MQPLPGGVFHPGSAPFGFFPGFPGYPTTGDGIELTNKRTHWRWGFVAGIMSGAVLMMVGNAVRGKKKWWTCR